MHRDFDGLAPHKEENKLKGAQFNEVKIGSAAAQGQSETHRRMVLASTRANIVDRKRHDNGYYYTSDLVFDVSFCVNYRSFMFFFGMTVDELQKHKSHKSEHRLSPLF